MCHLYISYLEDDITYKFKDNITNTHEFLKFFIK